MKLYTEEDIKKNLNPSLFYLIEPLLKPIELPSDEEIDKDMEGQSGEYACGWEDAFKWMKEQILNQKKS